MGTATFTNVQRISVGGSMACLATLTMSSSYATSGDSIDVSPLPFQYVDTINFSNPIAASEYLLQYVPSTTKIKSYSLTGTITGSGGNTSAVTAGTPAGTNSTSSVTAQTFTGTASPLNSTSPSFSGTGQSSAGQVITTTDNQTMTLNQCAGMWFVSATHGPYLIISNTSVVGAPAVLTTYGTAPTTDAGTYKIVTTIPVGTNGTSTAAAQTF